MASNQQCGQGASSQHRGYICSIIPPTILQHILNNSETSASTRAAVQKTFNHVCKLQANRIKKEDQPHGLPPHHRTAGIIPPQIFQALRQSEDTSSEQKDRADHNLQYVQKIHSARTDQGAAASVTTQLFRELYDSQKTDELNKTLLFKEGAEAAKITLDKNAGEVYNYFGLTYQFFSEVR